MAAVASMPIEKEHKSEPQAGPDSALDAACDYMLDDAVAMLLPSLLEKSD